MECACEVSMDIDSCHDDFHNRAERKAIKEHKCGECGKIIVKREKYQYMTGKSGGYMYTHKMCNDCHSILKYFYNGGFFFEQLWDDLFEFIRESDYTTNEKCLAQITPVAREKICDYIQENWDDPDMWDNEDD
jgi:RNase P subunit RPR2